MRFLYQPPLSYKPHIYVPTKPLHPCSEAAQFKPLPPGEVSAEPTERDKAQPKASLREVAKRKNSN